MIFWQKRQTGSHYYGNLVLWLTIVVLTAMVQQADVLYILRYDRAQVEGGRVWLLFSGHLVHANWSHWTLNMTGLGIVAVFFGRYGSPLQWLWVFFMAALFAGTGVYLFNPGLATGAGLSAVCMACSCSVCCMRYATSRSAAIYC
jgi:membrane associated rhomboid family serine protease